MKKICRFCASFVLLFALAGIGSLSSYAWGPERDTFTNEVPSDHVTFNSITNNAGLGDERNFVRIRELTPTDTYGDKIKIEPGKEYEVYIYYHNNAASNYNETGVGIAAGVKVASSYPVTLKRGEEGMVSGIIKSSNADPEAVWDEAYMTTDYDEVTLRYKTGSAVIHNAGSVDGSVLSTDLFSEEGTYIGINSLDGLIPGCAEYSGYIVYTLIAEGVEGEVADAPNIVPAIIIAVIAGIIIGGATVKLLQRKK